MSEMLSWWMGGMRFWMDLLIWTFQWRLEQQQLIISYAKWFIYWDVGRAKTLCRYIWGEDCGVCCDWKDDVEHDAEQGEEGLSRKEREKERTRYISMPIWPIKYMEDEYTAWSSRQRTALGMRIEWLAFLMDLNDSFRTLIYTFRSGGRNLLTQEDCPLKYIRKELLVSTNLPLGCFMISTERKRYMLVVCVGSHLHVFHLETAK